MVHYTYLYRARISRTKGVKRSTVSILCANTSKLEFTIVAMQFSSPLKSGTKHSTNILLL